MMRSMSYLPDMGLGRRQHGPNEFMDILDHDVPFGLGFIPTKADYRYMARLLKEKVKARLAHTSFDYPIRPYTMSLTDYFVGASEPQMPPDGIIWGLNTTQEAKLQRLVHQLQLGDGAPSTLTSTVVAPSSPDHMSCMTFHFSDEIDKYGTFAEIEDIVDGVIPHDEYINEMLVMSLGQIDGTVQPELASPFDLFGVSIIEVAEGIQNTPAPEFADDVIVVDELFDGPVDLVEGSSDFVDPPLSFDVLS